MIQPAGPREGTRPAFVKPDGATQNAVRRAVLEATGADDRVQVTNTVATLGWGDVLRVKTHVFDAESGEAPKNLARPKLMACGARKYRILKALP